MIHGLHRQSQNHSMLVVPVNSYNNRIKFTTRIVVDLSENKSCKVEELANHAKEQKPKRRREREAAINSSQKYKILRMPLGTLIERRQPAPIT